MTADADSNIIVLSQARAAVMRGECKHSRIVVDSMLAGVKCDDCGEELNPVAVLHRMACEQSLWSFENKKRVELMRQLSFRTSKKCPHCGKMVRLKP